MWVCGCGVCVGFRSAFVCVYVCVRAESVSSQSKFLPWQTAVYSSSSCDGRRLRYSRSGSLIRLVKVIRVITVHASSLVIRVITVNVCMQPVWSSLLFAPQSSYQPVLMCVSPPHFAYSQSALFLSPSPYPLVSPTVLIRPQSSQCSYAPHSLSPYA